MAFSVADSKSKCVDKFKFSCLGINYSKFIYFYLHTFSYNLFYYFYEVLVGLYVYVTVALNRIV